MVDIAVATPIAVGSKAHSAPIEPARLQGAFRIEELAGQKLSLQARLVAIVIIAVVLVLVVPFNEEAGGIVRLVFYEASLVALGLSGFAGYWLNRGRHARPWQPYLFVTIDYVILAAVILGSGPLFDDLWPAQMALRYDSFMYLFIFISLLALSFSPRLMLWGGVSAAASWVAGVAWIVSLPDTFTRPATANPTNEEILQLQLDEHFVNLDVVLQEAVVIMIVAGILAAVVWRSRRLVTRQASLARERANLSRYFSPQLVDELAGRDEPLGPTRRQDVAVLFADIVGFTTMAEAMEPEDVMRLLRDFHGRMEAQVFAHGGTLEKFIGDAMLATFGVPRNGPADARNALACVRDMIGELDAWNTERAAAGLPAIDAGFGAHFGPAVMGDIGSERNMAFAVIGDTVNTTSRLQGLTRELGAPAVVSDALVRQAGDTVAELDIALAASEPVTLRGRSEAVALWVLRRADAD